MDVRLSHHDDAIVVHCAGTLDEVSAPDLRMAVDKALAQQPVAVVCDLGGVRCPVLKDLTLLFTIYHGTSHWPEPLFVLAGASSELSDQLSRLGMDRRFVVTDTVTRALEEMSRRPRPPAVKLKLGGHPRRVRAARRFAADHCRAWGEPALVGTVSLLVSELATTALRDGMAPEEVRLTLMTRRLRIAVRSEPQEVPDEFWSAAAARPSMGLFLVAELSRSCGTEPTGDGGGQLMWCLVDRTHEARRLGRLPI